MRFGTSKQKALNEVELILNATLWADLLFVLHSVKKALQGMALLRFFSLFNTKIIVSSAPSDFRGVTYSFNS
ncbi:MAG: hypothetical protein CMD81_03730 [Gammaproteobacteria bacterium]|nr:hypothetical protein [Gammaproteobacteria bacterium]HBF08566.1 hypothetical protein [Gammaproteobacteria bacterium]